MVKTGLQLGKNLYGEDQNRGTFISQGIMNMNGALGGLGGVLTSPESDCNSNNLQTPSGDRSALYCSNDSTHDFPDFVQDNNEYQWIADYGYREHSNHQQSILSLSMSHDFVYYDDMARNLDANLAEVDMDDFHREDIHSILSTLPPMCCNDIQGVQEREMYASVSGSMMAKFEFDSSLSPHSSSQEEENVNSMSVCKSELLFSPVRDTCIPTANLSVDSLDLSENDVNLLVTCQANKNNYTIAFEGSTVMGSEESDYNCKDDNSDDTYENTVKCNINTAAGVVYNNKHLDNSLVRSDSMFTTWSKLKQRSSDHLQLRRHPSGNNNVTNNDNQQQQQECGEDVDEDETVFQQNTAVKSQSLPNLRQKQRSMLAFSMSSKFSSEMGSSMDSGSDCQQNCVKLFDIQKSNTSDGSVERTAAPSNNVNKQNRPHNFNLVKLFMKQKSGCNEMSMDQSTEYEDEDGMKKRECTCGVLAAVGVGGVLKNNWIHEIKHKQECSMSGFEDSLVTKQNMKKDELSEISDSESVEQITEPSKQLSESVEQITDSFKTFDSRTPSLSAKKEFNVNNNNSLVHGSSSQENCSNTESTENYHSPLHKHKITIDKSIQTDDKHTKVPMYILYPNYCLPNLKFLKQKHYVQNLDFSKIFLRPVKYQNVQANRQARPFSLNDIEELKKKGFKHVRDWDSLTFLLPRECKQFLKEIPSIVKFIKHENDLRPLFCLSPPPTRRFKKCECYDSNISTATPSSGFRGSSTMLTSSSRRYEETPPVPDRSTSISPPRPPLPRGILRNSSVDSTKYCKLQKENANKRCSMFELVVKDIDKPKSNLEKDMLKLEQLLEISSAFGENYESLNENDISKLKSQVSKFITMQKDLEKVNQVLQKGVTDTYNIDKDGDLFDSHIRTKEIQESSRCKRDVSTPHNTPEHADVKQSICLECGGGGASGDKCNCMMAECNDCVGSCHCKEELLKSLKKTVSFAEKICVLQQQEKIRKKSLTPPNSPNVSALLSHEKPVQCKTRFVDVPICEEGEEFTTPSHSKRLPVEIQPKKDLVNDVKRSVETILRHYTSGRRNKSKDDDILPHLCLQHLCPSLYAVLSDGLKEEIVTQFGSMRNSVWNVVEAAAHQGPMTQTLDELVNRLNRDDVLTEGLVKFNAFVFGLLNVKALDGWLSFLRTRDSLLRKYYDSSGLVLLSNTGGANVRILMDQLIDVLQPLSTLTFNLDLMYQAKLLHQSLLNINSLLEATSKDNSSLMSPTKQFMLLKLVKSIQNSINQSCEEKKDRSSSEDIEKKTTDPPVTQLLERTHVKNVNTRRPRSGYEQLPAGQELSLAPDVTTMQKRRWSGLQQNSKLFQAFERLGEDTESEYTDSLDKPRVQAARTRLDNQLLKRLQTSDNDTSDDVSLTLTKDSSTATMTTPDRSPQHNTKEYKKNILYNLNKKASLNHKTDDEDEDEVEDEDLDKLEASLADAVQTGGHKFRRLQKKWEMLTGKCDSPPNGSPVSGNSPVHRTKIPTFKSSDSSSTNVTTPSPTTRASKIPRLVTSPVRPTANTFSIPPAATKLPGAVKKLTSPTSVQTPNRQPPTRPMSSVANRQSRLDDAAAGKSHAVRPSSLPYRTLPVKKTTQAQPRASSMSLNRRPVSATNTKIQSKTPRIVRTLSHRLPSDSGHLPYNEGDKLKVVLEVDDVWLLCCRGNQKGLVPKSAVISIPDHTRF